jgi:hypothetical protein
MNGYMASLTAAVVEGGEWQTANGKWHTLYLNPQEQLDVHLQDDPGAQDTFRI